MKRYYRIAGIVLAVLIVLLIALPCLIKINSFRPKIETEVGLPWAAPSKLAT
jgi:hypothetical protein